MGKNTAVAGGLLRGIGEYMVSDAEQKRKEGLERARMLAEGQEKREAREHDAGLVSKTVTDEKGNIYGVTKGGKSIDLGIKGAPPKGAGGKGGKGYLSPEDKRLWDSTVQRHTTKGLGGEQTDWDAVSSTLRDQGREDLANLAGQPAGSSGKVKIDSPEYREAQRQADAWVDEQADAFGFDSDDFKQYGGNREEARTAKTLELYRQITGQGGAAQPVSDEDQEDPEMQQEDEEDTASPGAQPAGKAAQKPPTLAGAGTQQSPFKATTQADIEWFKTKAPAGSVIEVNGKLYGK